MWSRPLLCAFVWLTLLPPLTAGAQTPSNDQAPQTTNSTTGIPMFYANSRQVIVEADVWDRTRRRAMTPDIDQTLAAMRAAAEATATTSPRLNGQGFSCLRQWYRAKINYFKEADFPAVDMTNQWDFFPTAGGTWRRLDPNDTVSAPRQPIRLAMLLQRSSLANASPSVLSSQATTCRRIGIATARLLAPT